MNIVITGVTRGLGRALCDFFIREGHTVAGCGRSADGVLDLRFAHASPHRFDIVDITQAAKVDIWVEKLTASMPAPDILINNAGYMNHPAPFWKVPVEEFDKTIDINLKGTANVLRALLPYMLTGKQGVIVNFSSSWGRTVSESVAPYCAAKWGIEGLTAALARDLPPGMSAVALDPGTVNTDMLRKYDPTTAESSGESSCPDADKWAEVAGPFILNLNARDNGKALTVPLQ